MSMSLEDCKVDPSSDNQFVRAPISSHRFTDDCAIDNSEAVLEDDERSLETAVLLHELRIDALRAAGMYDDYVALCQRALIKAGTLQFHNCLLDRIMFRANLDRLQGIGNVATAERLRTEIEAAAATDYEARFGTIPQHIRAVNVRSTCSGGIWQAVVASGDTPRAWYRVEIVDDEFELAYLEGCDVELDDRFTVVADMAK